MRCTRCTIVCYPMRPYLAAGPLWHNCADNSIGNLLITNREQEVIALTHAGQ